MYIMWETADLSVSIGSEKSKRVWSRNKIKEKFSEKSKKWIQTGILEGDFCTSYTVVSQARQGTRMNSKRLSIEEASHKTDVS